MERVTGSRSKRTPSAYHSSKSAPGLRAIFRRELRRLWARAFFLLVCQVPGGEPAPILWTPLMSRNTRGCVHGTQEEAELHGGVQGRGGPVGPGGDEVTAPTGQGPGPDRVGAAPVGAPGRSGRGQGSRRGAWAAGA